MIKIRVVFIGIFLSFSAVGTLAQDDLNHIAAFQAHLQSDPINSMLDADPIFVMGLDRSDYQGVKAKINTALTEDTFGFAHQDLSPLEADASSKKVWYLPGFYDSKGKVGESLRNSVCAQILLETCIRKRRQEQEEGINPGISFLLVSSVSQYTMLGGRFFDELVDLFSGQFVGGLTQDGKLDLTDRIPSDGSFFVEALRATKFCFFPEADQRELGDLSAAAVAGRLAHYKSDDVAVVKKEAIWVERPEAEADFTEWIAKIDSSYDNPIHISYIPSAEKHLRQQFSASDYRDLFGLLRPEFSALYEDALLTKVRAEFDALVSPLSDAEIQKFKSDTLSASLFRNPDDKYGYQYFCDYNVCLQQIAKALSEKHTKVRENLDAKLLDAQKQLNNQLDAALVRWEESKALNFSQESLDQEEGEDIAGDFSLWGKEPFEKRVDLDTASFEAYLSKIFSFLPHLSGKQKFDFYLTTQKDALPYFKRTMQERMRAMHETISKDLRKRVEEETAPSKQLEEQKKEIDKLQETLQAVIQNATRIDFYTLTAASVKRTLRYATISTALYESASSYNNYTGGYRYLSTIDSARKPPDYNTQPSCSKPISTRPTRANNPEYYWNLLLDQDGFAIVAPKTGQNKQPYYLSYNPGYSGNKEQYGFQSAHGMDTAQTRPGRYSAWRFLEFFRRFHYDKEKKCLKNVLVSSAVRPDPLGALFRVGSTPYEYAWDQFFKNDADGSVSNWALTIQWEQEVDGWVLD